MMLKNKIFNTSGLLFCQIFSIFLFPPRFCSAMAPCDATLPIQRELCPVLEDMEEKLNKKGMILENRTIQITPDLIIEKNLKIKTPFSDIIYRVLSSVLSPKLDRHTLEEVGFEPWRLVCEFEKDPSGVHIDMKLQQMMEDRGEFAMSCSAYLAQKYLKDEWFFVSFEELSEKVVERLDSSYEAKSLVFGKKPVFIMKQNLNSVMSPHFLLAREAMVHLRAALLCSRNFKYQNHPEKCTAAELRVSCAIRDRELNLGYLLHRRGKPDKVLAACNMSVDQALLEPYLLKPTTVCFDRSGFDLLDSEILKLLNANGLNPETRCGRSDYRVEAVFCLSNRNELSWRIAEGYVTIGLLSDTSSVFVGGDTLRIGHACADENAVLRMFLRKYMDKYRLVEKFEHAIYGY